MKDNIIKSVCKELGLTYKELGEKIGYSESNINKVASSGKISNQLQKAIEMYLKNLELEQKLKTYEELRTQLKNFLVDDTKI